MGIAETILEDHGKRLEKMEEADEADQAQRIANMWYVIKLLCGVTLLTLVTEKAKDRWQVIENFLRGLLGV